jgi:DNA-binding MurR/RpiR family transcriptional regulator
VLTDPEPFCERMFVSARLALRIQERLETLSPSERRLALLLLERQDDVLTYSAAEMARLADVSKATAVRLFHSLGYRDFNEVRLQAREERNRTAPFQTLVTSQTSLIPGGGFSPAAHMAAELAAVSRSFQELSSERIDVAVSLLREAPRIWVYTPGIAAGMAQGIRHDLLQSRGDVAVLGGHETSLAEDLSMTGPRDALLAVLVRPFPRQVRTILDFAATSRMNVIAITDVASQPTARRVARVILPCHTPVSALGPSLIAIISLARLIAASLFHRNGAALRRALLADIREELDENT